MHHWSKCKICNYKTLRRKLKKESLWLWVRQKSLDIAPIAQSIKRNVENWALTKLRTSAFQKTLLGEWKHKSQIPRKYLQITYALKDL